MMKPHVGVLPNVVLIYLDNIGYGDIALTGAYGYKTPNLDQMAADRREPGIFVQTGGH